jgi:quercetin dioxygenase-like cupin family protein
MQNSGTFQLESKILWEDLGNGVKRQVVGYDEQLMVVKVKFDTGAVGALHQHPHVQVSQVHSGIFEALIGDEKQILREGDGFYVAPNVIHGVVCLEAGILIDSFTPQRGDFLPFKG